MPPGPWVSVVLPVHNQGDHIGGIIDSYIAGLDRLGSSWEILLVPNACTDDSVARCEERSAADARVRIHTLERGGWGRAVRAGLASARGELLCYTNSARTTEEMLVLILAYAQAYPDVVLKANRRIRDNWLRRLGSLLYNLECRALFDLPEWDVNGTPKVFPRKFGRLLELEREDDLIDAEFNAVCREEGYRMIEVPVLATVRHGGSSTTRLSSALRLYWGAYRLWRDRRDRAG